jgi:hypothetical protein
MTNQEAWTIVFSKYPKTEAERKCLIERNMMNAVRNAYFERLLNESKAEADILGKDGKAEASV